MVIVEGIYSMEGELCKLLKIVVIFKKYKIIFLLPILCIMSATLTLCAGYQVKKVDVKKSLTDEGVEAANKLVHSGKEHHPSWLVGRLVRNKESKSKSSSTSCHASSIPDHYVSDLTAKIRAQLQQEMDEKLDQKVLEMMQKLSD